MNYKIDITKNPRSYLTKARQGCNGYWYLWHNKSLLIGQVLCSSK